MFPIAQPLTPDTTAFLEAVAARLNSSAAVEHRLRGPGRVYVGGSERAAEGDPDEQWGRLAVFEVDNPFGDAPPVLFGERAVRFVLRAETGDGVGNARWTLRAAHDAALSVLRTWEPGEIREGPDGAAAGLDAGELLLTVRGPLWRVRDPSSARLMPDSGAWYSSAEYTAVLRPAPEEAAPPPEPIPEP